MLKRQVRFQLCGCSDKEAKKQPHGIVDMFIYDDHIKQRDNTGRTAIFQFDEKENKSMEDMLEDSIDEMAQHGYFVAFDIPYGSPLPSLSHTRRMVCLTCSEAGPNSMLIEMVRLYEFADRVEFRTRNGEEKVFRPAAGETVDDVLRAQTSALLEQGYKFIVSPAHNSMADIQWLIDLLGLAAPQWPAPGENDEGWER